MPNIDESLTTESWEKAILPVKATLQQAISKAETSIGKFPLEAVQMINSLVKQFARWTPESSMKDIIFD